MKNKGTYFVPKTLKQIKEYDTFELLEEKDWNKEVPADYKTKPFFNEAVLKIPVEYTGEKNKLYVYINAYTNDSEFYLYDSKTYDFMFMFGVNLSNIDNPEKLQFYKNEKKIFMGVLRDENCRILLTEVANVLAYISYTLENRDVIIRDIQQKNSVSKSSNINNSNNKRKIEVSKNNLIIYKITTSDNDFINKRNYSRHTEGWSVIGHFRTLKNGKKIWVNPYYKGKKQKGGKKYIVE